MALKDKAARGVFWTLLEYGGGEIISFAVFLVLARVITPSDFGVVSLALVFVSFVQMFLVQGFADAVIQRQEVEPDHCSTAFWANLAIAALFSLLILIGAGQLETLFHAPHLAGVLRALAALPVGTALTSIHQALFRRRLEFANFAKRAVIAVGTGGAVGVALALAGFGVWSLVAQQLTNAAVSVVVFWWASDWRPSFRFSGRCLRDMAEFSASVMGSNLMVFIGKKADVTLIGYFFSTDQLGYYYLVQRLLWTAGYVTQSTIQSIVMPVLSRVQDEPNRFRAIFARTVEALNAVWLPLALGAGLTASLLLPTVFGPRWQPSVPLLEIMSLCGFTDAFYLYSAPTLAAAGRPRAYLKLSLIQVVVILALVLPGTQFGLAGVAAADVAIAMTIIPFNLAVLKREIGIAPGGLFRRCAPATTAGIAMAAAVLAVKAPAVTFLPPFAALAVLVLSGAAVYAIGLTVFAPAFVRQMQGLVLTALGRSPEAGADRIETAG